jgi:hypothetical protein
MSNSLLFLDNTVASQCEFAYKMEGGMSTTMKISLRGSIADEVAKRIRSAPNLNIALILKESFQANSSDIVQIPKKDIVLIGKKSDLGKFPPDW